MSSKLELVFNHRMKAVILQMKVKTTIIHVKYIDELRFAWYFSNEVIVLILKSLREFGE